MCHYCEFGKNILKEVKDFLVRNSFVYTNDFSPQSLISYLTNLPTENSYSDLKREIGVLVVYIKNLESFEFHKTIANRQRKAYNEMRTDKNLLKNRR